MEGGSKTACGSLWSQGSATALLCSWRDVCVEMPSLGFFEEQPRKPRKLREEHQEEQQEHSLSWKVCGISPAGEGVRGPGKAHGTVQAGRGAQGGGSSLCLLGTHGYAPLGTGWLLTRQVRAQHKKSCNPSGPISLHRNKAVSPSVLFHLFYFCWV